MSAIEIKRIIYVFLFALFGVSVFLRFFHLEIGSYWYDELVSVRMAKHTPADLLVGKYIDPADTPLHPILLSVWIRYFGESEVATRVLSGVISVIAVAAFYLLISTNVRSRFTSLITTVMFGSAWMHLYAAREARYYSLLLLLSTVGTYLFFLVLRKQTKPVIFVFAFISVLGILTHYGYIVLIIGFIVIWVVAARSINILLYLFLVTCLSVPALLPRFDLSAIGSGAPFWDFVNTLFQYKITGKFEEAPISAMPLVRVLIFSAPDSVRVVFIVLFLGAILYLFKRNALSKSDSYAVYLFGVLVSISLLTPVAGILNNWYYYYFLTPVFFLVFGIVLHRIMAIPRSAVGAAILAGICIWSNSVYMMHYSSSFNTWHFDKTVNDIIDGKVTVIVFGNEDLHVIVDSYLMKVRHTAVTVYNGDDYFPLRHQEAFTAFIAYAENAPFWEKVDMSMMLAGYTVKDSQVSGNNVVVKYYAPK